MSVYQNMGVNLRALCKQKGTISQVCSEVGINRQQFTKYLNGENFPRQQTLEKICKYFGVRDIDLFMEPVSDADEGGRLRASPATLLRRKETQEILKQLTAEQEMPLSDGMYATYIYPQSKPDWLVRSVTIVKTAQGITEFRRVTCLGESKRSAWYLWRGNHRGMILNRRGILYLMALDKLGSQVPSLSILQWSPSNRDLLKGLSIVLTPNGAEVCSVVMEALPKTVSLKDAIRNTGALGVREADVPLHIKQVLHNL